MDFFEMDKLASERAQQRNPKPKYEPAQAGMVGFLLTSLVTGLFAAIGGLDLERDFAQAASITALVGFVAPYLYFRNEEKQYYKAYAQEMEYLKSSQPQADSAAA